MTPLDYMACMFLFGALVALIWTLATVKEYEL
jgi:hypothetical protein